MANIQLENKLKDKQTYGQTNRWASKLTKKQRYIQTDRWTIDGQTKR